MVSASAQNRPFGNWAFCPRWYRCLSARGIDIESKPYALGVRVEHPQSVIDDIQYGRYAGHPNPGAAAYGRSKQSMGWGVQLLHVPRRIRRGGHHRSRPCCGQRNVSIQERFEHANSGMVVTIDESVYGPSPCLGLNIKRPLKRLHSWLEVVPTRRRLSAWYFFEQSSFI